MFGQTPHHLEDCILTQPSAPGQKLLCVLRQESLPRKHLQECTRDTSQTHPAPCMRSTSLLSFKGLWSSNTLSKLGTSNHFSPHFLKVFSVVFYLLHLLFTSSLYSLCTQASPSLEVNKRLLLFYFTSNCGQLEQWIPRDISVFNFNVYINIQAYWKDRWQFMMPSG